MEWVSGSQIEPQFHASPNSTYFHILPTEIFPTIIKYVILQTNSGEEVDTPTKRRQRIVSLSMLVSDDCPFRDGVSQLRLTEVELGRDCDTSCLWMDNGVFVIGPELFENEGQEFGIPERILQLCGKSVKVVSIRINSRYLPAKDSGYNGVAEKFVTLVNKYCANIEKLCFTPFDFEDNLQPFENAFFELVEQFSSQLRSIEWKLGAINDGYVRVPDISMCTNLRELIFPSCSELISFLRTFGTSLESLTVSYGDINWYPEMLDTIEHNCANLATVLLRDCRTIIASVGEERYASFLCCFGTRLACAEVVGLSFGPLTQVIGACPNLLVPPQFVSEIGVDEWERVLLLGPMIKSLTVAAGMCGGEQCEEALAKCTNLDSLAIEPRIAPEEEEGEEGIGDCSDMTFLFSLSTSSLYYFEYCDFIATQQNIDALSLAFGNLLYLKLDLVKPIENGIDFKSIIRSNPQLDIVFIQEYVHNEEEREKDLLREVLRMLVKAFSKCRSFNLILNNNGEEAFTQDEVRDICAPLLCRGTDVEIRVGSTWYRQTG